MCKGDSKNSEVGVSSGRAVNRTSVCLDPRLRGDDDASIVVSARHTVVPA